MSELLMPPLSILISRFYEHTRADPTLILKIFNLYRDFVYLELSLIKQKMYRGNLTKTAKLRLLLEGRKLAKHSLYASFQIVVAVSG